MLYSVWASVGTAGIGFFFFLQINMISRSPQNGGRVTGLCLGELCFFLFYFFFRKTKKLSQLAAAGKSRRSLGVGSSTRRLLERVRRRNEGETGSMEIYMNRIHSNYCVGAARGGAAGGWNLSVGRWLEHVATGMRKWVDEIGERETGKGKP